MKKEFALYKKTLRKLFAGSKLFCIYKLTKTDCIDDRIKGQKTFTVDFLSKKKKTNSGEIQQYYIEDNHEAIIAPEEFDLVQAEIGRRKKLGLSISTINAFASKIICSDCGCFYGQKVWHSNDKYRKVVWRCNGKFKGDHKCTTPTITEEIIKLKFMEAYHQLSSCREQIVADVSEVISTMTDTARLDEQIAACEHEMREVDILMRAEIQNNASCANQQEAFDIRYSKLEKRYSEAETALNEHKRERIERLNRQRRIALFLKEFESTQTSNEWDETLWKRTIESVVVNTDGSMDFKFVNGQTVSVER